MPTTPLKQGQFYNPRVFGKRINDETARIDSLVAEAVGDNVDDSTLEVDGGVVQVKAGGIDGPHIATGALQQLVGTAGNGAGARTLTGAAVGDRVVGVVNLTDGAMATSSFESTITVADQIQQSGTDLTSDKVLVTLLKA